MGLFKRKRADTGSADARLEQLRSEAAAEQKVQISIRTDRPEAVYEKGEDVTFLIELTDGGEPVDGAEVKCELSTDGFRHSEAQPLVLAGGKAAVTASRDEPCVLWIRVT